MVIKLLCEKAGALQGMSVEAVVRQAYGPCAFYDLLDDSIICKETGHHYDTVLEMHES